MDPGELLALEAAMRAPDAIMEPGMAETVGQYIRAGGKPEDVIESLTTSYEGYAQMASLVCDWARAVDAPYAPPGATGGGGGAFDAAPAASSSSAAGGGRSAMPLDELTLLQELAKERFNPDQLLSVFRRGRPTWLHELTADARGRRLILDLSAEHRSSIFLNYAIRRIFDGGHDDEVAAVGSSLSSYFEVYHRLLARRLEAAAAATSGAALARLGGELAEACAASQHTYAHAQHVLSHLSAHAGGGVFRRMGQELEAAAAARHGGAKVWAMQPLFVPRDAGPGHREAVRLVSRALVLGAGGGSSGGSGLTQVSQLLSQLQELYARGAGPGLPLEPLRHPCFLQMLLEGLFSWQQPPAAAVQRSAAQLLALAAAGSEAEGAGADPAGAVSAARGHLEAARALAGRAGGGEKLTEADLDAAAAAARGLGLAGLGLLHYAGGLLGWEGLYEDDRCGVSALQLLALLQRAAAAQPGRAPGAIAALRGALGAMGVRRPELAEAACGSLLELLLAGHAPAVLAAAEDWASGGADPSLVRAFALRVLDRAGPPYSRAFAAPLLRLMLAAKMGLVRKAGTLVAAGGAVERLREFAVECLEAVDFAPPLGEREAEMLERLAA
ncbi:MAG: TH1 protein [Monoraphidium minutum]|nr:MAG: TH1 protein [Monoraphidium minutum]